MSRATYRPLASALIWRPLALTSALGVLCIAGAAMAEPQSMQTAFHHQGSVSSGMSRETVEQRISSLHHALKITPDEETNWTAVAQTMRWNEAAMQKLIADRKAEAPHGATALDDLRTYEKFNRAHVEGLKDLIASFGTLYNAMPDTQKVLADHVFQRFGRDGLRSNG
jgi:hypothetical protein